MRFPAEKQLKEAIMKKNHRIRKIILTILFLILAVFAAVAIWVYQIYLQGSAAASSIELLPADLEELPAVSISDDELNQLISGDLLLDDLPLTLPDETADPEEASSAAAEEEASAPSQETAASTASSSSLQAASSGKQNTASSTASSAASSSSAGSSTSSSSSASRQEEAWEKEIRDLLVQVYAVRARAEAGLNSCIESAKAEYHALPEEKQTQTRKVTISLAKAGELSALQSSCDKEMERIVSQMRKVLQENGQSTALADQVMEAYKKEKSTRIETLKNQLYGG